MEEPGRWRWRWRWWRWRWGRKGRGWRVSVNFGDQFMIQQRSRFQEELEYFSTNRFPPTEHNPRLAHVQRSRQPRRNSTRNTRTPRRFYRRQIPHIARDSPTPRKEKLQSLVQRELNTSERNLSRSQKKRGSEVEILSDHENASGENEGHNVLLDQRCSRTRGRIR